MACAEIGIKYDTYRHWRMRFKEFAARCDAAKAGQLREDDRRMGGNFAFDFARERLRIFGNDSPWFQLQVVQAMESLAPGGILLVLLPPEHGKTTMFEDWACLKLGYKPDHRFHVGSESIALSKKILARCMDRMNPAPGSRMQSYVAELGPFAPPEGERGKRQPWQEGYFDVWRKESDERDYSMVALGFGSQIIGSRSDHLHCDDLQSLKTLGQTDKNLDKWRQDWLTRPGESGITTVMGNRVDEGDIYEGMMEELDDDLLQVIKFPAIMPNGEPLWPERWTLEKLDRMRRKVTDPVWERNWMQRPRPKGQRTFTEEVVGACKMSMVPLEPQRGYEGRVCYIGLDPGLYPGTTSLCAIAIRPLGGFDVVATRRFDGLTTNEQIMGATKALVEDMQYRGMHVTDLIIEAKNFQAGLARDERLLLMRDAYGLTISEHQTGWNKYDENIGVPSMVTTFIKQDVGLPWAEDEYTRFQMGELINELLAWRPFVKGTKLRQDRLMALYFCWIKWRQRRGSDAVYQQKDTQFDRKGLPYAATQSGLVLPRGAYPSVLSGR
jgi:hypothetical protein